MRIQFIGGGMFREVMTLGAFYLCLELMTQLDEDTESMSLERNRIQRQPYRDAIKGVIALAENRMQLGETNVKGYLFLSMGLGQIDAIQNGAVPEEGIFAAAKQSATRGYEILSARLTPQNATSHDATNTQEAQDCVLKANGALQGPLNENMDFNFDEWASWLFPTTDEIPWASLEDYSTAFPS